MTKALNSFGHKWSLNPGDGAFYGPKIDIQVFDAMGRAHQCATVQLDFQLPIRFKLKYNSDETGVEAQPVIVHRAILGSVERLMGVLIEHTAGKWCVPARAPTSTSPDPHPPRRHALCSPHTPNSLDATTYLAWPRLAPHPTRPFWLSPRQAIVIPVAIEFQPYADQVAARLFDAGFQVTSDSTGRRLPKMVRMAQQEQYNFILVVGEREVADGTVTVRVRDAKADEGDEGAMSVDALLERFQGMAAQRSPNQ